MGSPRDGVRDVRRPRSPAKAHSGAEYAARLWRTSAAASVTAMCDRADSTAIGTRGSPLAIGYAQLLSPHPDAVRRPVLDPNPGLEPEPELSVQGPMILQGSGPAGYASMCSPPSIHPGPKRLDTRVEVAPSSSASSASCAQRAATCVQMECESLVDFTGGNRSEATSAAHKSGDWEQLGYYQLTEGVDDADEDTTQLPTRQNSIDNIADRTSDTDFKVEIHRFDTQSTVATEHSFARHTISGLRSPSTDALVQALKLERESGCPDLELVPAEEIPDFTALPEIASDHTAPSNEQGTSEQSSSLKEEVPPGIVFDFVTASERCDLNLVENHNQLQAVSGELLLKRHHRLRRHCSMDRSSMLSNGEVALTNTNTVADVPVPPGWETELSMQTARLLRSPSRSKTVPLLHCASDPGEHGEADGKQVRVLKEDELPCLSNWGM